MPIVKKLLLEDGSILNYSIYGQGFPLILLHGNGNDQSYFDYQIQAFSEKYQVITIDSRGQGASTNTKKYFTYQTMTEDLNCLFEKEQIKQAHILGFSDGANIAMIFAFTYPEKVSKLILNAGNISKSGIRPMIRFFSDLEYFALGFLGLFSKRIQKKLSVVRLMVLPIPISKNDLRHITACTLVIVGKKDVVKVEHSLAISSAIPRAKFVVIKNQGHRLAHKSPNIFNHEVLKFLEGGN